jgi:NTP pyrophosphatase (non-canonical NTP hydrolase)
MKKIAEKEYEEILQQFTDAWGLEGQKLLAIEEMAELTKELSKHLWRDKDDKQKSAQHEQNIREEIADVLITVGQIRYIFGAEEVDKIIDRKIQRTVERLKKWQEEQQ